MAAARTGWTGRVIALVCVLALAASTALPTPHVPRLIQVLADHTEMIAAHGHSHGLEDDIAWAMHGHSHDKMDHDHAVAMLPPPLLGVTPIDLAAAWQTSDTGYAPPPIYRTVRPPRV